MGTPRALTKGAELDGSVASTDTPEGEPEMWHTPMEERRRSLAHDGVVNEVKEGGEGGETSGKVARD